MSEEVRLDAVGEVRCLLLRLAQELMLLGGGSDGPRVVESGHRPQRTAPAITRSELPRLDNWPTPSLRGGTPPKDCSYSRWHGMRASADAIPLPTAIREAM